MDCNLLFVQTNRNQLSYNRFEDYSLKRVNDYFDSIQTMLHAPASARLVVVNQFDNPVPRVVRGTNDFDYVTPETRHRIGLHGTFLQKSVADQTGNTAYKGDAALSTFRDGLLIEMDAAIERSHQPATRPRFAVVDHNAAHDVSAPLAEWAFANADASTPRVRIIVNFDFYADSPDKIDLNEQIIRCDNWAGFMTRVVPGVYPKPIADAYVNFGVSSGPNAKVSGNLGAGLYQLARNNGLKPQRIIPENHPTPTVTEQLATVVGWFSPGDVDVYISIDRDFMVGSYTPWGDGSQLPHAGRAAVLEALLFFQKGLPFGARGQLVGFDVTGLPALGGFSGTGIKEPAAIEQANDDLITFYRQVRDY
ncbi:hypothetical protein LZC95_51520 [Pendulispora brunnea]|uniref:Uncharacterized protein n=1 Tax=Pendulispora brunnea TaxID=2905690 RepID=A0ABZ2K846_9BACT